MLGLDQGISDRKPVRYGALPAGAFQRFAASIPNDDRPRCESYSGRVQTPFTGAKE
jgi:hypothetical protein